MLRLCVPLCLAFVACAHNVEARFPALPPGQPVGAVTVRMSHATTGVSVTINGALVADGEHTSKVTVAGVPAGPATVAVVAGGAGETRVEKSFEIQVVPYGETTVLVAAPEDSLSTAIWSGLYSLGTWIFLGAIYCAIL